MHQCIFGDPLFFPAYQIIIGMKEEEVKYHTIFLICLQVVLRVRNKGLMLFLKLCLSHRHLRIYRLLNGTYRLPCLLNYYCKWLQQKKEKKRSLL
jgi:hypothetical protein